MVDESFWVNIAFTVLGALIGAGATLLSARLAWQNQSYNEAASVFRTSFVEQIHLLRKGDTDVYRILDEVTTSRHERAKIIFEPFLSARELRRLEEAWTEYINGQNTAAPGSLKNRAEEIRLALSRIERLIACAARK